MKSRNGLTRIRMERRSCDIYDVFEFGEEVIQFKRQSRLDLTILQQLPTYRYVIERFITIKKDNQNIKGHNKKTAIIEVSKELIETWVYMNIPPRHRVKVQDMVTKLVETYDQLARTDEKKRGDSWKRRIRELADKLNHGFDIKANDEKTIQACVDEYGVEPGEDELFLYEDNCTGDCPRLRWCGGTDGAWYKKAQERRAKMDAAAARKEKRESKVEEDQKKLSKLKAASTTIQPEVNDDEDIEEDEDIGDEDYIHSGKSMSKNEEELQFPQKSVRTGYKSLDPDVMMALVVMESVFKVDARKAPGLLCFIANTVFKQKWIVTEDEETDDVGEPSSKKRKRSDYEFALPARKTIAQMIKSFAILSFADMAEQIQIARENERVVTFGSDDTVKAAGKKKYDIKTGHITIIGENKERETFTTGFHENPAHTGVEAAKTVKHDIVKMAVLTNNSYEDMLGYIDFFMSDRAGDGEVMCNELKIEKKKRLKCNAHPLLAVENAMDKVFKDMETKIGVSKLISAGASHCFNAPKNSVWYLGLIALAKLLSPSHAKESISLYCEYQGFLKRDISSGSETSKLSGELVKKGFKGFVSNRFGRIGELSTAVVKHKSILEKFFEKQVNEHANKLVLAVSCYTNSQWFNLCCEVSLFFYDFVSLPFKCVIGIDEFKKTSNPKRSWRGIKEFFSDKLNDLEKVAENNDGGTMEKLRGKCAKNVKEALQNQLSMSAFFLDDGNSEEKPDDKTLEKAPLTNLGCESEFGFVTNDFKEEGGSTSLATISDKHIVARNKLFEKERFTNLSKKEKQRRYKWARNSPQAKEIHKMEKVFLKRIESVGQLAVKAKEDSKRKATIKLQEALENCQKHKGPLIAKTLHRLDKLTDEQVKAEATFLKKTTAPNIRYKRLVDKKMVNFTTEELKQQIRDAILPSNTTSTVTVETLIENALELNVSVVPEANAAVDQRTEKERHVGGTVAWWKGPLDEEKLGVVVDDTTLQLYELGRFGFKPRGLAVELEEWRKGEVVESYSYEARGTSVYLVIEN